MRLTWLTDIHLDFADVHKSRAFYDALRAEKPDAVVITGDISNGQPARFLRNIWDAVKVPVYFVLGNHDYYGFSIFDVRLSIDKLCKESGYKGDLFYLGDRDLEPVELSPEWCLIGVDGWNDARHGHFTKSDVYLNDYNFIKDLSGAKGKAALRERLQNIADYEAKNLAVKLTAAFKKYPNVVVATHVPPFKESAWYDNKPSDNNYLPHFSCKATGDAMEDVFKYNETGRILVLCGHTHGKGIGRPHSRIQTWTGKAEYGTPQVQATLTISADRIDTDLLSFGTLQY